MNSTGVLTDLLVVTSAGALW